ncbi:porphobilinogen synthase [Aeropyrum camini]|uniref:Delta-aminolevulinic acid dehydratase n=1 Tax=Aeropyrum camini SY1 = JCM 12091 TaxID=1198449 RepID=U3TEN6_9CREN|nr:porphobilinogen synthase [Aeropyrum camini]BAN90911.1 delta-aminolevulinic acid dehydratase [Aeropyrum camini SY1 = JCM 12091]
MQRSSEAWLRELAASGFSFPRVRARRLRIHPGVRSLVAETRLDPSMFILPLFVEDGLKSPKPLRGLPGHYKYPPESRELVELVSRALDLGVRNFLIFGTPGMRNFEGSEAWSPRGPVQRAIRFIRGEMGWKPVVMADVCLCGYTDHGHCGYPRETPRGVLIENDRSIEAYGRVSVSLAEAGADFVAPSGMMDGQVAAIRRALDEAGYTEVGIMSYSAKYASGFYGPFRDVMDSSPRFGDRRSYQMDPRNRFEAVKEVLLDAVEGADIVMVKPALSYLDVISEVKRSIPWLPLAAYNVSGEYLMLKAAAEKGLVDYETLMLEVLTSIARAGADAVITYHALEAAEALKSSKTPF